MTDIYQLGCKAGLLNYIDHETPRVYFIHAHADLEDFEAFCKALVEERDAEIELLREALRFYANKDNWKSTFVQTDSNEITFDSGPARRENGAIARAALEEKE